jgi:cytoskeletal protein CcmA (bactofilin family)
MFLRRQTPAVALQPNPQRPQPRPAEPRHVEPRLASPNFTAAPTPAPAAPLPAPERAETGRTLAVGRGITLSGAIAACETLLVEGQVEATSFEGRLLDIAAGAGFKGNATVEIARIAGDFDGELHATTRLEVAPGGRVKGRIHYAKLEISAGGELAGEIALLSPGV